MTCEKAGEVMAKTRSKLLQLGAIFCTYSKVRRYLLYLSKQLYNPQQCFPTSFCMSPTLNVLWFGSHRSSSFRTCWMYLSVQLTVILSVSTSKPRTICLGPTINSNHFSSKREHCPTVMSDNPQIRKIASMVAVKSLSMCSLKAAAASMSLT